MDRKYIKNFGPQGIEHPGCKFQIKLLILCLLKGFKSDKKFKLSTGNKNAPHFNDIIFETVYGDILMTIHYKDSTRTKPLNYRQLLGQVHTLDSIYDDLYFFSQINQSTFRVRSVRYVTNIRVSRSKIMKISFPSKNVEMDDVCALRDEYYILGENCQEILRKGNPDTSEEHLSDFLSKFQLVSISEKMVNEEIRRILEKIEICDSEYLPVEETIYYLVEKITRWFSDLRSSPLENHHAAAFLSEFRTLNFSNTLKRYNITFKKADEQHTNRVLHLVNKKHYVLSLLKFYHKVFEAPNNWIFVDPDERLSVRRVIVEAFLSPENRFLVVPIYGQSSYGDLRIDELLQGISNYEYKRIAFLSDRDSLSQNVPNIRIIESRVSFEDLEENCKNTFLDASVDFQGKYFSLRDVLGPEGNANEIIDEETLLKLSTGENIKIEKLYREEDIGSLYIDRSFVRDEKTFSERDLCDLVVSEDENKFILISEDAGMGKSTALTRITRILNEQSYPRFWVIRLDFNRYANVFRKLTQDTAKPIEIEDILSFERPIFQNNFDKSLFNVTNKVLLLIDGVDVVRSSHKNRVLQFLKNTADRTNIARIIITTRPHLESLLEEELRVSCFKLKLFSSEDQINFLAKYWKFNLELSQRDALRAKFYARNLVEKLYRKIGKASLDFVGIPLQTKMIAEIFQEGGRYKTSEWKGCREFLISENISAEMSEDINIARLYEIFVKKKGEIFIDDKCEPRDHVVVEDVIQNLFQEALDVHKKIALESVLDSEKCKLFAVYRNTNIARLKQYLQNMGLAQRIETSWIFVHQTFAEYFVSSCLWEELKTGNELWPFLHFLVSNVLVSPEFSVVRSFLDNILMDVHIPEEILSACGSIVSQISWHQHRNIVHLAKEGRLNILKLLLEKCNTRSYLLQIENIHGEMALHEAVENPPILEYLVLRGANVDRANSRGQTALHRASEKDGCTDAADFLIRAGAEVDIKLKDGRTPLHCAAQKNSFKVAAILIAGQADLNATEQTTMKTPLHLAAENDSLEVARLLIKAGAKVLARTGNQQTALELAQLSRSSRIIKLLKDELTSC
nr:uncharacterized protein LOC111510786 [Leptinotarsa decemlineata]